MQVLLLLLLDQALPELVGEEVVVLLIQVGLEGLAVQGAAVMAAQQMRQEQLLQHQVQH